MKPDVLATLFTAIATLVGGACGEREGRKLDEYMPEERKGNDLPNNITLQVFVICDSTITAKFSTHYNLVLYVVNFFNAVNLIFQQLEKPSIRLEVVLVQETRDSRLGAWQREVLVFEGDAINAEPTLTKLANYTRHRPQYKSCDIIYLMTARKVFFRSTTQGSVVTISKPPGWAFVGKLCTPDKVAIGHDDGVFFTGTRNAARQIARVMGAHLDGVESGAYGCSWKSGHLMGDFGSELNLSPTRNLLSSCSQQLIRQTLSKVSRDCLTRKYRTSYSDYSNKLPGEIVKEDDFCKTVYSGSSTGTCSTWKHLMRGRGIPEQCGLVCCTKKYWIGVYDFSMREYPAFDGKACGKNKVCIVGKCVQK
ncbi:A disintegrin and metalloproteinase with thrombospondin motifs like [Ornithodoros turicata]